VSGSQKESGHESVYQNVGVGVIFPYTMDHNSFIPYMGVRIQSFSRLALPDGHFKGHFVFNTRWDGLTVTWVLLVRAGYGAQDGAGIPTWSEESHPRCSRLPPDSQPTPVAR
jgi:hypothetical protein